MIKYTKKKGQYQIISTEFEWDTNFFNLPIFLFTKHQSQLFVFISPWVCSHHYDDVLKVVIMDIFNFNPLQRFVTTFPIRTPHRGFPDEFVMFVASAHDRSSIGRFQKDTTDFGFLYFRASYRMCSLRLLTQEVKVVHPLSSNRPSMVTSWYSVLRFTIT